MLRKIKLFNHLLMKQNKNSYMSEMWFVLFNDNKKETKRNFILEKLSSNVISDKNIF
jgi:hypothetical protein